jgi:hypothetical protein
MFVISVKISFETIKLLELQRKSNSVYGIFKKFELKKIV